MALFFSGETPCSICGYVISEGDDFVGTTHFISDDSDPLWKFSDSVMHRQCYENWEHRDEFTTRYRTMMGGLYPGSHYETWPN